MGEARTWLVPWAPARFLTWQRSATPPRPSWQGQIHAQLAGQGEGQKTHAQDREHEGGGHFATRAQQRAPVRTFFALVVMPLDGEEHAGAKHEHLEHNEDYGDPIDHF